MGQHPAGHADAAGRPAGVFRSRRDLARARALVRQSGRKLPIRILLAYVAPDNDHAVATLAANLDAVGFRVALRPLAVDPYYAQLGDPTSNLDAALNDPGPDFPDGANTFRLLLRRDAAWNYGQFGDAATDRAIDAVSAMPLGAARTAAWSALATRIGRISRPGRRSSTRFKSFRTPHGSAA